MTFGTAREKNAAWYVDTTVCLRRSRYGRVFRDRPQIVDGRARRRARRPRRHTARPSRSAPGLGRNCVALADHFDRVVGVDIAPEMIRQSRALVDDGRCHLRVVRRRRSVAGRHRQRRLRALVHGVPAHPRSRRDRGVLGRGGAGAASPAAWSRSSGTTRRRNGSGGCARAVLATLQRTGLRREAHRRNAAQFLGTTVDVSRIRTTLDRGRHGAAQDRGRRHAVLLGVGRKA